MREPKPGVVSSYRRTGVSGYWRTGESTDKAGACGIQGLAIVFIEHPEGRYSGVTGLPLFETSELLYQFGIKVLREK